MTREQWLEERKSGIGASDAAAILGYSTWKNNVTLWEEKTGRRKPEDLNDPAIQYGNDAEPLLRELFALDFPEYRLTFEPHKIVRNHDKPFIFATPDGELEEISTGRRGGLEIKTAGIRKAQDWLEWQDKVPDAYFCQVLHQMLACAWEFVVLKAQIKHYNKDGLAITTRHYQFERSDYAEDIDFLEKEVTKFWEYVESDKRPSLKLPQI